MNRIEKNQTNQSQNHTIIQYYRSKRDIFGHSRFGSFLIEFKSLNLWNLVFQFKKTRHFNVRQSFDTKLADTKHKTSSSYMSDLDGIGVMGNTRKKE